MSHFNIKREKVAKAWTNKMYNEFGPEITKSINNSIVYRQVNPIYGNTQSNIEIIIEDLKSDEAIYKYGDECTVLNFASYKHPGGGFIKGSIAQEEALCHSSFLYNVIGDDKFKPEYEYNLTNMNNGLYTNFGIYSPLIMFTNGKRHTFANVITVPAPNIGVYAKYTVKGDPNKIYRNTLVSRIKFIYDIAQANNCDTLILGAFGCGVFKNDPQIVAHEFKRVLNMYNYTFKKIIFAIPNDGKTKNYEIFKNEMNRIL